MNFTTPLSIPHAPFTIDYQDRILMLGSCFADNLASKLGEYFFQVTVNPTGTLYNPVSVARHFSENACDVAVITFGTAWVYLDKTVLESGVDWQQAVVDNCMKRPATDFIRQRLTVEEIVDLWSPIVERHPSVKFLFTVSPIRHIKDGFHQNQISKAILLQAIDELIQKNTDMRSTSQLSYFPSYEILLDELRDYRFYASDMLHPSEVAVEYIFQRFVDAYLYPATTKSSMQQLHQLWLDMHHKPLFPDSVEYRAFCIRTEEKLDALRKQFPWLPCKQKS